MPLSKTAAALLSLTLATGLTAGFGSTASVAQIKPYSADDPSFNAPEMRRHGSGLHRPNRPHVHHRHYYRHHGWRSRF